jgi:hypothetical protein
LIDKSISLIPAVYISTAAVLFLTCLSVEIDCLPVWPMSGSEQLGKECRRGRKEGKKKEIKSNEESRDKLNG